MRIIIAGSRSFNNYPFLHGKCSFFIGEHTNITIVSGTARGADQMGERFAKLRGYAVKQFPAYWDMHGKRAGYVRNEEMAKFSDALIAFWDGKSRGTRHMIDLAKKHGLRVRIVRF
jgi:hypothetical protein